MSQIYLDEALGVTENMPPKEIANRWIEWKALYSGTESYAKLSPVIKASLDSLAASTISYESSVSLMSITKNTYDSAVTAYNTAMAIITGGASTTMIAAQTAYKTALSELKNQATALYNSTKEAVVILVNQKVDSSTQLND